MSTPPLDVAPYLKSEKWIARLTILLGALAAIPVGWFYSSSWGAGILVGTMLAWFNFRWLRQGLEALTTAATAQANRRNPRVPIVTYFKALFRYGLIALAVYVIFKYLNVPILSMIFGLCALGAATLAVSVYEILHPQE
ncbi:MAG TPA: ATP synthase subunit I [Candidatus Acidoferrum sp.]|jgi:small-conductance mechanosensitive channel|nr:ATP synthase subunit I [Candidatus Acidoferrum sp.]